MTDQTYTRKSNAQRAAVADLGKDAVEGRDYEIQRQPDGRYTYATTKPDTGDAGETGATPPARPQRASVGADKRDRYGLRVGTKGSAAASMLEAGCTMAEIKEATGGTRYNFVRKLTAAEHEIVRGQKGQLTLRHNGG